MFSSLSTYLGISKPQTVTISKLLIHPIKSCHGTVVESAVCTRKGLKYDREFMIIDANTHKAITAREMSKMVLINPEVHPDPQSPDEGTLHVSIGSNSGFDDFVVPLRPSQSRVKDWELIDDIALWGFTIDAYVCAAVVPTASGKSPSEILSDYLERPVLLVFKGPAPRIAKPTPSAPDLEATFLFQDGYPLLVLSNETIRDLAQRVVQAARKEDGWAVAGLDESKWDPDQGIREEDWHLVERFRPNIVFDGAPVPFDEDSWEEIVVEDGANGVEKGKILLVSRCTRCLLPNVDPLTGIADKAVPFKVLSKYRRIDVRDRYSPCIGVNAASQSDDFEISVGDKVSIVKRLDRGSLPMSVKKL